MKTIRRLLLGASVLCWFIQTAHGAVTLETLYSFGHHTNVYGANPWELIRGQDGNFYGATYNGGLGGYGTVYRITTAGELTTLHAFHGTNGSNQQGVMVQSPDGVFYGTTISGGTSNLGTIFKLTTNGVFTSLVSFTNDNQQGSWPYAGLALGTNGLLYGLASQGGSNQHGTYFVVNTNGV